MAPVPDRSMMGRELDSTPISYRSMEIVLTREIKEYKAAHTNMWTVSKRSEIKIYTAGCTSFY